MKSRASYVLQSDILKGHWCREAYLSTLHTYSKLNRRFSLIMVERYNCEVLMLQVEGQCWMLM